MLSAVFLVAVACSVAARVCPSVDVRNRPQNFDKLRGCRLVMGHLRILLMDAVDEGALDGYVFPELEEIEDHLILFNVKQLRSVGRLFPNLRVIRGRTLFLNNALVVFKMDHLEEIELSNLQYIGRGAVRIDFCPKLCFADTIDWRAIGASSFDYIKTASEETCRNKFCPGECRGYCWNNTQCQRFPPEHKKCHPQCIGCTKEGSSRHCMVCKHYEDHGNCVDSCPATKYANNYSMKCLTKEECTTMLNGTWWVFEKTCVQSCPLFYELIEHPVKSCHEIKNYKKVCNGTVLDSLAIIEEMAPCTHINGSLDIRISESYLEPYLEKNLGRIVSISGNLKIGRSSALRSLEFLRDLREIKGEILENRKALFVFENPNLQRLWNFSTNFNLTIGHGTIAFHDNPQLCITEIEKLLNITHMSNKTDLEISKFSNGDKAACNPTNLNITILDKNSTSVTLRWDTLNGEEQEDSDIIGYMLYYVEASKGNVTSFENKDACDVEAWGSVFVRENTVQLKSLSPYTRYGYYIKTYTTASQGEQTPIYYFKTASDDPLEPIDFQTDAKNDTAIVISWKPPALMNGKFSHYRVIMYLQEDFLPLIEQRNYCLHPHTEPEEEVEVQTKPTTISVTTPKCVCREVNILNKDGACLNGHKECDKFEYHLINENIPETMNIGKLSIQKRTPSEETTDDLVTDMTNQTFRTFTTTNETDVVGNLRHFSVYIFFLRACNEREGNHSHCGPVAMVSNRTRKREDADFIQDFRVTLDELGASIQWTEPLTVNSVIVSYQIQHKRVDLEHAKAITECITKQRHLEIGQKYRLFGLSPGTYRIRVRATSLAGPGPFSQWKTFEISPPNAGLDWVYALVGTVCIGVVALVLYLIRFWYRRKYALDNNHLITSINPDYAGPIYEEDEWEIDRSDVQIIKELGQGSFGMVYEGLLKSRGYPCAIKTVNESANITSRMEFLNEGAVMKAFNDAHHVIKLVGIVSRGQPPLVIMELMERGDLKNYLRRCREPSQNLTTNEIYRMAAEIADGMAYLAAKKFVHRDLAARNCMVAADRTVKIGDFGMARDIYETDYYRKETVGLLPVRWMAPESLADGVFTTDSDVWSYGIVLWEMATLAEQPYQGHSNEDVFHFVKGRGRLSRPPECSDLLYEVMDACWQWRPNDRPTFADIVGRLVDHVGEGFRHVSFCCSRQGRDLALSAGPRVYNPPAMASEDDFFGHYDAEEEEVSLYVKERPAALAPSQRYHKPYRVGSPSSAYSFDSS